MRLSRYFVPVLKENPAEAQIVSHRLMLRAGLIKQATAGIYSWLPLGFKVLRRLENIIHEEQQRAGHQAIQMPILQSADLWRESGRYDDYGQEMLRMKDRHDRDLLFTPTAEELVTDIFRSHITSYKDLPLTLYQIQWKFRDEIRPRFGVMRGREFYMKDGYNFDLTKQDALHSYNRHLVSYLKTYERMGLKAIPMRADSGPIGGEDTHEFLVLAETGESEVFYDSKVTDLNFGDRNIDYEDHSACQSILDEFTSLYARTDETHEPSLFEKIPQERQCKARGIEVGQIFYFGTKYSEAMGATVTDANGCAITVSKTITSSSSIVSNLVTNDVTCNGDNDGSASVLPAGGSGGALDVQWWDGTTNTNTVSNIAPKTFAITVNGSPIRINLSPTSNAFSPSLVIAFNMIISTIASIVGLLMKSLCFFCILDISLAATSVKNRTKGFSSSPPSSTSKEPSSFSALFAAIFSANDI